MKTTITTLVYCLLTIQIAFAQEISIMSYNCENAFDTIHDEGKNDPDYLPEGTRHWSRYRMYQKLKNIGKVIVAADNIKPIDIICLEEVENDTVMTYLTRHSPLTSIGYEYVMTNSADTRGIDVALLYSPFSFRLLHHHSIRPTTGSPTRDVLYVSGTVGAENRDTIDIYAVHLPSKLNGRESEKNRQIVVNAIMQSVDSLHKIRQFPKIIILGDFNDGPHSKLLKNNFNGFINLAKEYGSNKHGSYKYKGAWDTIDQILVSKELIPKKITKKTSELMYSSSYILTLPFLLEDDIQYGGQKPRRTFIGYKYNGGFSDHLPVIIKLQFGSYIHQIKNT